MDRHNRDKVVHSPAPGISHLLNLHKNLFFRNKTSEGFKAGQIARTLSSAAVLSGVHNQIRARELRPEGSGELSDGFMVVDSLRR